MTKPHSATPEQWESIERWGEDNVYDACFLELRARIEALEAAQMTMTSGSWLASRFMLWMKRCLMNGMTGPSKQKIRSAPESPLVERVADAIAAQATSAGIVNDRPARAAILEVISWLREKEADYSAIRWLEQEADQ